MKNLLRSVVITAALVASIAMVGCEEDKDRGGTGSGNATVTLTHSGYDFSTGMSGEWETNDGETISWMPGGGTNPDYPRNVNVWWRPAYIGASLGKTKDMGAVSLSSVTSIPSTWDTSPNIPALIEGHVIVAECRDGYVKFRVISVDPDSDQWEVEVEYEFSATGTF